MQKLIETEEDQPLDILEFLYDENDEITLITARPKNVVDLILDLED